MPAEEGVAERVVVVVAGGEPPGRQAALAVPAGATVIAADSGLEHAVALGLDVAVAVGDFDSASPAAVAAAEVRGVRVARHAPAKDATDLELAFDEALALRPDRVVVLAGAGDRLDHLLSLLLLLGAERFSDVVVDAVVDDARVHVVRGERVLAGEPDELVSLLALHGPAEGVRTEGLEYPLTGETLEPGSSRGVSNVFAGESARVAVERGVVLAICPGADEAGARAT
jgi:thiamine pyrophosphokinase